jgi:signal transduction histidine kinase
LLLTNFGMPSAAAMAHLGETGYSWLDMDGERWRIFSLHSAQTAQVIQVAERASLRDWSSGVVSWTFLLAVVPSFIIVLAPALWGLRRLLRPLRHLADELRLRSPTNLDQVHVVHPPTELVPVVSAVNWLFGRVADTIQRETAFTSLAAHELRTPLAALRVLADAASQATEAGERESALSELTVCVDRCAHLQEQLLTLSRLDSMDRNNLSEPVELTEIVDEALLDLRYEAHRSRVKLSCRLDGSAIVGHRYAVLTLTRNLISNAIRYTPPGGRVEVATSLVGDSVLLHVDDSGPGIPASERSRMFERFERLHRDQQTGVGLGLSIVRTVAQMHDAVVTLHDSALGGLRVVTEFKDRALKRPRLDIDAAEPAA